MEVQNISLRDYQEYAIERFFHYSRFDDKLMLVMPTGTGKTTVFSALTQKLIQQNQKVLLGVHRTELVEQIQGRVRGFGIEPGVIAAGFKPKKYAPVQVASIQTLSNREAPPANVIIIDECHHARAESYRRLWDIYPKSIILGVTATPVRTNGDGFDDLFQRMIQIHNVKWYIDRGYLVKPKLYYGGKIDTSSVPLGPNGDYDPVLLAKSLASQKYQTDIFGMYSSYAKGLKTIVFAPTIPESEKIVQMFQAQGYSAAHIDGETPPEERRAHIQSFKKGETLILSNVDLFGEGFDVPDVECVILGRPTKSLALYLQQVGRVLRPAPGKKCGIVLDCVGVVAEHNLPPGVNVEWTLEGKPKVPKGGLGARDGQGKIHEIGEENEIRELDECELIELTEDMQRLFVFKNFLQKTIKAKSDPKEALRQFNTYLELQGEKISDIEFEYCNQLIEEASDLSPAG